MFRSLLRRWIEQNTSQMVGFRFVVDPLSDADGDLTDRSDLRVIIAERMLVARVGDARQPMASWKNNDLSILIQFFAGAKN